MNTKLILVAITFSILTGGFIQAAVQPLAQALTSGKVCERSDGYIQSTPGNELKTRDLVESVNAERASVYADIARKEGLDPSIVGAEHAKEIKNKHPNLACR